MSRMTTTSTTCALAALRGSRTRALVVDAVVNATTSEWYAPAMHDATGFGHKRPTRRPPSPT